MNMINIQQPEFGRRLKRLRAERGLSQRDVAVGVVNPSYISLLESGSRVPTLEVALHIARALDVPLNALVEGTAAPIGGLSGSADGRLVRDLLARNAYEFGDLAEAQARFTEAYQTARGEGSPLAVLTYGLALQDILVLRSDDAARDALLVDLAIAAEQLGTPELIVRIRIDRAAAARDVGRLSEALELAEQAAEAIGRTDLADTSEHVRTLGVLVSIRCDCGDPGEVPRLIDQMLRVATALDSAPVTGRAHWVASVAYSRIGRPELAERHVREAREMLATPATSVHEWAKFSRAAASALLESGANPEEVVQYLNGARAASTIIDAPADAAYLASLETRYALATGDAERAVRLSDFVEHDPGELTVSELARLRLARGRALHLLGRTDEAAEQLRVAATLCDDLEAYRLAAQIWRELAELRPH
ncbi:helix-turn-helix domain-containing protein [Solihabitans fulvus]|nr:helix-turn-helix transcriptional regulator [Solihabitans fulvus]